MPCPAEFKFLQDGDFTTKTSLSPPFSKLEISRLPAASQCCPPEYPHHIYPLFEAQWDSPPAPIIAFQTLENDSTDTHGGFNKDKSTTFSKPPLDFI